MNPMYGLSFIDLVDTEISPIDWLNIAKCAERRWKESEFVSEAFAGEYRTVRLACGKAAS